MSAHAPAPWWATDGGVRNSGGYIVHTNSVQRYEGQDERYEREVAQREADKRLIAAAPDLLDALSSIRTRLLEAVKAGCSAEEAYDSFYRELIDEAIAKAVQS